MRTIAIVNQKGGCGKTTTAVNLAGVLARFGERVLLVDLDPQAHCAAGLAIPEDRIDLQIGDVMLASAEKPPDLARLLWRINRNLALAPSTMRLAGLEAARGGLAEAPDRDQRLKRFLDRVSLEFDWCLIDCPPAIGLLTYNALRAADEALIPVETSYFSIHGAKRQINTIRSLARRLGGQTPHRILVTMHDPESRLASELLEDVRTRFGERVLPRPIRLDPKLKEAASFGQPLIEFEPSSAGAADYASLGALLLGRPTPPRLEPPPMASPPQEQRETEPGAAVSETASNGCAAEPERSEASSAESPPASFVTDRAADLVARARRLAARSASLHARLQRDPDVAGVADPPPGPKKEAPLSHGPRETSRGVLFVHTAPPTSRVSVAGDFNGWSATATPMRYNEAVGVHEVCVPTSPGRLEYRFVVDGRWEADPRNPSRTVNPFGETNSVVVVTRSSVQPAAASSEGAD